MQRNKYLEDLGIKKRDYGTNFCDDKDKRAKKWKKERKKYGFDDRETWNLNHTFVEWLYSHLMMYNKRGIVDTTFHKLNWQGKEITQQDAIDILKNAAKAYLLEPDSDDKFLAFCDLMPLWGMLLPYMWW